MVRGVIHELISRGKVVRGWIGIVPEDFSNEQAARFGLVHGGVVLVRLYQPSPAVEAGLLPGDIITGFDGSDVKNSQDILVHIASTAPGATIKINGVRGRCLLPIHDHSAATPQGPLRRPTMAQPPPPSPPQAQLTLRRFADRAQLQSAVEERLAQVLTGAAGDRPAVMLSGGTTPIPAYLELARRNLTAAAGLVLLFSDDRYVPSDSDQSNFHQSRALFASLGVAAAQVLRIRTELPLTDATLDSERQLVRLLRGGRRITLGLLGLGADGHTASLFSAADLARAQGRLAISVHRPDGRDAVSVTPTVLERVDQLIFVVAGADKRVALSALLQRQPELTAWQAVRGAASVDVWADAAASPG